MKRIVDTLALTLLVLLTFSFTAHAGTFKISPTATSHDFGNTLVNTSPSKSYEITNDSTSTLTINSMVFTSNDGNSFSVSGFTSGVIQQGTNGFLGFGAKRYSEDFTVAFNPTSTGSKSATLKITYDSNKVYTINFKGKGVNTLEPIIAQGDLCYNPPKQEGLNIFGLGLFYGVSTTIDNISSKELKDVTIIKSYDGFNIGTISELKLDNNTKSTRKGDDEAEVDSNIALSLGRFGIIDGLFNKGIIYYPNADGEFTAGGSHTVYDKSTISINWSKVSLNAIYFKDGNLYQTKIGACQDYTKNNERDFALVESHNIRGDIQTIGNSMLLRSTGACAPNSTDNNNISTTWADKDNDSSTFNSTSADLALPKGVGKDQILYAAFYWQGRADGNKNSSHKASFWDKAKQAKFKAPGLGYQTLTAPDYTFNWTKRSSDTNYQGVVEVTGIVKESVGKTPQATIDSSGFSGTFWGADIQADKIKNGFGAWSLVVIYKDPTDTLKNISLYDGYISVNDKDTKTTELSGFLTPTKGDVNSKFLIFGGEGDVSLGDSVSLSNPSGDKSLGSNIFKSAITIDGDQVTNRSPNCQNTIGIDLHTFDIGTNGKTAKIMQNGQTSTKVKLKSTGDVYYPGMFTFTTELYEPDVCYMESVWFDGVQIGGYNVGDIDESQLPSKDDPIEFRVMVTNKDNTDAKGVVVSTKFENENELTYIDGSFNPDNLGSYDSDDKALKAFVGADASSGNGGLITKNSEYNFSYKGKIGNSENISANTYYVRYENADLGVVLGENIALEIRQCADFNSSIGTYVPQMGDFNIVRRSVVSEGETVPLLGENDPNNINALYTQIVGQTFEVDIVALGGTNKTTVTAPTRERKINIDLLDENLVPIPFTMAPLTNPITFGTSDKIKSLIITPLKATKNAHFKITPTDNSEHSDSRDGFAIRPATYKIVPTNDTLIGGRDEFIFQAVDLNESKTNGYTQTLLTNANNNDILDRNATSRLVVPTECNTLDTSEQYLERDVTFTDGHQSSAPLKYPEVGKVEFKLSDNDWTKIDSNKGDCIADDNSTIPDVNGKVGCLIRSTKTITFIPASFDVNVTVANSGNGFTYIADDANQSAFINVRYTALLGDDTPATNYTKSCFAKNLATNITFDQDINALGHGPAKDRITYYGDGNITSSIDGNTSNGSANFTSSEQSFSSGVADITYKFNFARDATIPDNPFAISSNMFNINTVDDDAVNGSADLNATGSSDATFLYGRAHAAKHYFVGDSGSANIYFEAYCYDATCAKSLLPNGNDSKRTSDVRWYINEAHQAGDGAVQSLIPLSTMPTASTPSSPSNGKSNSTITYDGSKSYPYTGELELNADAHLVDDNSKSFQAEFSKDGAWAGRGDSNSTTQTIGTQRDDDNRTLKSNRVLW